jgi:hypothetical protein
LVFDYRGWHVDVSRVADVQFPKKTGALIQRQLDIVCSAHLKPEIIDFMRSVRLWANPAQVRPGAAYYFRRTGVEFRVRGLDPDKPILLHELLHAYHDRRLGSESDSELSRFYRGALEGKLWPPEAYMMRNEREFFAVTGTVYLFGSIDRPPYDRRALMQVQPDYYAWLGRLVDREPQLD